MPQLIKGRAVVDDRWTLQRDVSSPAELAEGAPVIVPLAFWLAHRDALLARGDVGVWLAPSDDPAALADVGALPVIAVDFPKFTDGRGYSIGALPARPPSIHRRTSRHRRRVCATSCSRWPNAASTRSLCAMTAMPPRRSPVSTTSPASTRRRRTRHSPGFAGANPASATIPSPAGTSAGRRACRGIIRRQVRSPRDCGRTAARIPSRPPALARRPMPLPLFRLSPFAQREWLAQALSRPAPASARNLSDGFRLPGREGATTDAAVLVPLVNRPRRAAGPADATKRRPSRPSPVRSASPAVASNPTTHRTRRPRCARPPRKSGSRRRRSRCSGTWPNTKP